MRLLRCAVTEVACVASVSNRVIARKVRAEAKKKKGGRGRGRGEEEVPSSPPPPPSFLFFLLSSRRSRRTHAETLAMQAITEESFDQATITELFLVTVA